jgi:hypothetical protein
MFMRLRLKRRIFNPDSSIPLIVSRRRSSVFPSFLGLPRNAITFMNNYIRKHITFRYIKVYNIANSPLNGTLRSSRRVYQNFRNVCSRTSLTIVCIICLNFGCYHYVKYRRIFKVFCDKLNKSKKLREGRSSICLRKKKNISLLW